MSDIKGIALSSSAVILENPCLLEGCTCLHCLLHVNTAKLACAAAASVALDAEKSKVALQLALTALIQA